MSEYFATGSSWASGCVRASLALVCSMLSLSAFAASNQPARIIEEIVVTAEKREGTLQSTPIAITAIGQQEIEARGIQDMSEVQYIAPNLTFNQTGPTGFITMRGVGLEFTTIDAEPGVALYSDGTYRGGSMASTLGMFDLERIEVVRGPQGTLNGRNSTGGSINIVSRLPGDEASFEAAILGGDYDRYRLELAGDIPVSDNLAIRLAGVREDRGGYSDNSTLDKDEDGMEYTILKGSAVYTPTDNLEVILRAEYGDSEQTGPLYLYTKEYTVAPLLTSPSNPGGLLNIPGNFCGPVSCADFYGIQFPEGVSPITNPRKTKGETPTEQDVESTGGSLTMNYQMNEDITLRSITSFYDQELDGRHRDIDGTELAFFTTVREEDQEEFSQELTLLGSSGSLDWILGGYYYESDVSGMYLFEIPALQTFFESFFGIAAFGTGPLPPGSMANFGTRIDGTTSVVPFLDDSFKEEIESKAIYAQGTYNFSDTLRATLGVRRTDDDKKFSQTSRDNLFGEQCTNQKSEQDWSETTGKIGIDADLSDTMLLYGSVSRGYRAGGFDAGACFDEFDPETLTAYEVGLKMDPSDTLRVNLSAFVYDYEDYQARLFTTTGTTVLNASGADIMGAEAEFTWLATDRFRIDGSASFLDSEFKDFLAQNPMRPEDGLVQLKGNSLLRAPEFQASLTAEYDVPTSAGLLTFRGEYAYLDEQHHSLFNDPLALEPSRSIVNARVFLQPARFENVTITGFVNNLTDDEYKVMYVLSGLVGGVTNTYGAPRTWGVQIRYKI